MTICSSGNVLIIMFTVLCYARDLVVASLKQRLTKQINYILLMSRCFKELHETSVSLRFYNTFAREKVEISFNINSCENTTNLLI